MKIKIINTSNNNLPEYKSKGASGMDLRAYTNSIIKLNPLKRVLVNTGIKIEIPNGYEAQIRSRSGLAINNGIVCLNSPGTIDSDFRGEISIILINFSDKVFIIKNGDRIAQIVISCVKNIEWNEINNNDVLKKTIRGENGFGSTGI